MRRTRPGDAGFENGGKCAQPGGAGKGQDMGSLADSPEGTPSCGHPDSSPVRSISDFWPPALSEHGCVGLSH